ncbi:GtrA family protein [Alicyclobacillus kakegawensis]|uniref:GtrA family protein n=1 Tax=Alicyclobacillus kakegawensis TaxID=392012 RepID=UPI000836D802|nr:GtrA family protein [Alicyclobacillus kakegawensis]
MLEKSRGGERPQTTIRQSLRFGLVGALNTAVDMGTFFALVRLGHWHAQGAQGISYTCSICNSYLWNRYITFRRRSLPNLAEVVRFAAITGISYGVSEWLLWLLQQDAWPLAGIKVTISLTASLLNFIGSKWWVFRRRAAH